MENHSKIEKTGLTLLVVGGTILLMLVTSFFAIIGAVLEIIKQFTKHHVGIAKDASKELQEIWKS